MTQFSKRAGPRPEEQQNGYHDRERPKPPQPEINIVCVNSIERQSVQWLWPGRIPLGKLTLMCGDPGKGKSHVTMDAAARTSIGAAWPDGEPGTDPGSVIVFSAEDDPGDTIRPRLERAGADLSKCFVLESVKVFDHKSQEMRHSAFNLEEHVPLLETWVEKIGDLKLIVIDPISSYTGKTDSHKNAEVRAMLMALVSMAERCGIAILAVTHLNKGAGGKAVYRATGSLAFAAAARSVVMITGDLDDPKRRLMLPVKCNVAAEQTGLAFTIQADIAGSYVSWEVDPVKLTADGFLQEEAKRQIRGKTNDDSALAEAVKFLREQLADGPVLSSELDQARKANDIAPATLKRARANLGCKSEKRSDGKWVVCLPSQSKGIKQGDQLPTSDILDPLDPLDTLAILPPGTLPSDHLQGDQEYQEYQENHVRDVDPLDDPLDQNNSTNKNGRGDMADMIGGDGHPDSGLSDPARPRLARFGMPPSAVDRSAGRGSGMNNLTGQLQHAEIDFHQGVFNLRESD